MSSDPRSQSSPRQAKAAFAKSDLLSLLGTLFLLALLLLPALGSTSGGASSVGCLNNLRRLAQAWLLYAEDHDGRFAGNGPDAGLGRTWVGSVAETPATPLQLIDPRYSQLGPYARDAAIYRCPADASTVAIPVDHQIRYVPRARSYSMNHGVGTKADGVSPVDGPWFDGTYGHTANRTWRTYGRRQDIVDPTPARLWVLLGEAPESINDGSFALSMQSGSRAEWIDFPATHHEFGAGLAFADGRAELRHWEDARTRLPVPISRRIVPHSPDVAWLQARTSARVK